MNKIFQELPKGNSAHSINHNMTSDGRCDATICGLKLGSSQSYKNIVSRHRSQKLHKKNGVDKIFTGDKENEVFREINQGEQRNYGDSLKRKKINLSVLPTLYEFNKNLGVHDTMNPDVLEQIAEELKKEQPKESDKINKFLGHIKWQVAEWEVFDELALFFANEPGLLLSGYDPKQFLSIFVKQAEQERQKHEKLGIKHANLSELEKRILRSLNIETRDVTEVENKLMDQLKALENNTTFSTSSIQDAIDNLNTKFFSKEAKDFAKTKFKTVRTYNEEDTERLKCVKGKGGIKKKLPKYLTPRFQETDKDYTEEEIRNSISYGVYQAHSKFNAEWDFIIILPKMKAVINVEVKRNASMSSRQNSSLKSASNQLDEHAIYFAEKHGYFLDEQWAFLKLAAIKPSVVNEGKVCSHCQHYIITDDNHIGNVWSQIIFNKKKMNSKLLSESVKQFRNMFKRLVSFSSATRAPMPKKMCQNLPNVIAPNGEKITSGHTKSTRLTAETLNFQDIRSEQNNAFKTLYLNIGQVGLFCKRLVVFLSDYGTGNYVSNTRIKYSTTSKLLYFYGLLYYKNYHQNILYYLLGKTVVAKEKALRMNDQFPSMNVYFLSLAASNKYGVPEKHRAIFDILSEEYDFQDTKVNFVDAQQLRSFYKENNSSGGNQTEVDVLTLTEFFIEQNPDCSFILDEVPVLAKRMPGT